MHSETNASLASFWNCRHWVTGLEGHQAAHSRPSDRRRRTPDGRACCDDVVVRRDGGSWKIRSHWRLATPNVGWQQFTRYWGALPRRHRWTVTPSLWRICCGTSSQFSSEWSRCVKPRLNFPVLLTTRAAAFSKCCSLSVMVLGDPANTVLQPSMRDVMKACTRVFADSASGDCRILRIWCSQ